MKHKQTGADLTDILGEIAHSGNVFFFVSSKYKGQVSRGVWDEIFGTCVDPGCYGPKPQQHFLRP